MDFMEAVEEMKKGKKVRLSDWVDGLYITIYKNKIVSLNAEEYTLYPYCFDADWKLFEETKTLYDKIISPGSFLEMIHNDEKLGTGFIEVKYIQKFINNIRNEFQELRDDASAVGMEKQLADGLLRLEDRLDKHAGERFK